MKRLMFALATALTLSGCNREILDMNLEFNRALVKWPDGTVKELNIRKWRDYEGEQIQVKAMDGKVYLISSLNAVLIRD